MKNLKIKTVGLLLISIMVMIFTGCSKDDDNNVQPNEASPDLKFIGSWSGTTSQNKSISFSIENIDGKAIVTSYTLQAHVSGGGWSASETKWGTINAQVSNGSFSYASGSIELSGVFSGSGSVSGKFKTISQGPPGYGDGTASGSYTADNL
ncbi:MAG: hypothetical protein R2764_12115 [Bacteroidales bacterium]